MSSHLNIPYHVDMADGTSHDVIADQRDWAKMEAQAFPPGALVMRARFLAWSAATRAGLTKLSWDRFNDSACLDVQDMSPRSEDEDEDSEGEQGLDPGHRPTSGTA